MSLMTTRDVLSTCFSLTQVVITFVVTFLLNFLIVYYGEGGDRLVMTGIASPAGGVLVASSISPIFQTLLQTGGMQAWLDKESAESNLSVLDIELLATSWWARVMPGVRAPRVWSRCLWFALQALVMVASCVCRVLGPW